MKKYAIADLRNLALAGHGGSGKTSLAEAMLFVAKATDRLGRVDDGTSVMDYDPEEIKRKISLNAAVAPLEYRDHKINLLDTPGFFDFVGEVKGALRVADAVVIVVCAVSGVEVGVEKSWSYADEYGLPRAFFINKMDRENANFHKVLQDLRNQFGQKVIPLQVPMGSAESFRGIVDVVRGKAVVGPAGKEKTEEIPPDLAGVVEEYRMWAVEAAAEAEDELTTKYLEGEALSEEEILRGLRLAFAGGKIVPVFCGSAAKLIGVEPLLGAAIDLFPSPLAQGQVVGNSPSGEEIRRAPAENEPLAALVWKTTADPFVGKLTLFRVYSGVFRSDSTVFNVNKGKNERVGQVFLIKGKTQEPVTEIGPGDLGAVAKLAETGTGDTLGDREKPMILPGILFPKPVLTLAVEPKAKGDEEKLSGGLARLMEEDPTFITTRDSTTKEILVSGLGELHLEVIASKLQKKFGVEVNLKPPKVPYKETIRGTAKAEGKHKKQTGGRGQYGHVWLELEPLPGGEFEFVDKIFGGAVPKQYIPAVEKGVRETMEEGILAGYPVVDVRCTLYDGSYHSVDSSELAFKIAASLGFKKAFMEARPVLLEPIMNMEIHVPEQYMGDIIGDITKKRGRVLGMEPVGQGMQLVRAQAPLAEVFRYAVDLRSMTQGRGSFSMTFDHYEEVPANLAEAIIAQHKKEKEAEE
ncbi:MAG: elongation factor G [Firmicutes bacterium]|nr:elongation factor G [Bacillota bacterium]